MIVRDAGVANLIVTFPRLFDDLFDCREARIMMMMTSTLRRKFKLPLICQDLKSDLRSSASRCWRLETKNAGTDTTSKQTIRGGDLRIADSE